MAAVGAPVSVGAGLRPFNPFRDLPGVTALLATVFGPELSLESAASARLVRWMRRYPWIGWVWLGFDAWFDGTMAGFVWVDGGQAGGNANIAPVGLSGSRWILSNVAVDERLRGRGIGRHLVEACIGHAWASGADSIMLQVWERNEPALHLYRSLGFEVVGSVSRLTIEADRLGRGGAQIGQAGLRWRSLRRGDTRTLAEIAGAMFSSQARMVRPSPMTPFRTGLLERALGPLALPSRPLGAARRVLQRGQSVVGALAVVPVRLGLARGSVICSPHPPAATVTALIAELSSLAAVRGAGLVVDLPSSLDSVTAAMVQEGWELQDSLLQMSCDRPAQSRWGRPA